MQHPILGLKIALVVAVCGIGFVACGSDERKYEDAGKSNSAGASGASAELGGRGGEGSEANEGGSGGQAPSADDVVLLEDEFEENTASWTFIDPTFPKFSTTPKSDWSYVDGALVQSSNYVGCQSGTDSNCESAVEEPTLALFNRAGSDWTDYSVTVTFESYDDDNVGVVARYVDPENYLIFEMNGTIPDQPVPGYARLRAIQRGKWTDLAKDSGPVATYQQSTVDAAHPATLKLTVVGNRYRAYLDGVLMLDYPDTTNEVAAKGGVALTSLASTGVHFERVSVVEE